MDIEKIRELVSILDNSGLSMLEIEIDTTKIRLEKSIANENKELKQEHNIQEKIEVSNIKETKNEIDIENCDIIKSPMVGVFYSKPSPESEPFVQVGSKIKKGETVCIIEAMKLMNEIVADKDGIIEKVCINDGELVEFDQPLFYIK